MDPACEREIEEVSRQLRTLSPGSRIVIRVEGPEGTQDLRVPPSAGIDFATLFEHLLRVSQAREELELTALVRRLDDADPEARARAVFDLAPASRYRDLRYLIVSRLGDPVRRVREAVFSALIGPERLSDNDQVSADSAARLLGVSPSEVQGMATEGRLSRLNPGSLSFPVSSLVDYVKRELGAAPRAAEEFDPVDFARQLTDHFTRAAQRAIDEHHARGASVHTERGGKVVPIPPPRRS